MLSSRSRSRYMRRGEPGLPSGLMRRRVQPPKTLTNVGKQNAASVRNPVPGSGIGRNPPKIKLGYTSNGIKSNGVAINYPGVGRNPKSSPPKRGGFGSAMNQIKTSLGGTFKKILSTAKQPPRRTGGFKPEKTPAEQGQGAIKPLMSNTRQAPITNASPQATAPVQSVTRMAQNQSSAPAQQVKAQTVDTGIGRVQANTSEAVQTDTVNPAQAQTINPSTGKVQFQNAQKAQMEAFNPIDNNTGKVQMQTQALNDQATVEGRMNSLMQRDNPYMQQARARAAAAANARGLLNSSMAVTAGESAAYSAALPIAQQDAQTYFANDQQNLAYQNEQAKLNAASETDTAKFNADALMKRSQYNAGLEQEANLYNAGAQNEAAKLNAGTEVDIAKYNSGEQNQMAQFNNESAIKQNQFNAQVAQQNNQFNATSRNEAARLNAGTEVDLNKYNAQTINDINRQNADADLQNNQFNAQLNQQNEQFNASSLNDARSKFAAERNKQNFEVLAADLKRQMANVDQTNALELTNMEQQFNLKKNMDTVMGQAYQQVISAMSDIYANEKDGQIATDKVRQLLKSAGATFSFSDGVSKNIKAPAVVKQTTPKTPSDTGSTKGNNNGGNSRVDSWEWESEGEGGGMGW